MKRSQKKKSEEVKLTTNEYYHYCKITISKVLPSKVDRFPTSIEAIKSL